MERGEDNARLKDFLSLLASFSLSCSCLLLNVLSRQEQSNASGFVLHPENGSLLFFLPERDEWWERIEEMRIRERKSPHCIHGNLKFPASAVRHQLFSKTQGAAYLDNILRHLSSAPDSKAIPKSRQNHIVEFQDTWLCPKNKAFIRTL